MGEAIASPFSALARSISGAQDLAYATAAFQRKMGRWPKDYVELSEFVQKTDGLLVLGEYDHVDFSEQPAGGLQVVFVPHGQTNHVSFTFPAKTEETK